MPRRHKRKLPSRTYANFDPKTLEKALEDIRSKTLSIRSASAKYKISIATLSRKIRNKHMKKIGRPTVLLADEENKIVEGLLIAAEWGFPLTTRDLQDVVHSYLEKGGRSEPRFSSNYPGRDWVYQFRSRHPELTNRLAENIKRNRAEVSYETISTYFEHLERSLDGVAPNAIVNYDESNLSDDPGRSKVLVRRGVKHPERCLDSSKMSTTIVVACTASGQLLPPYVIYKAEHLYDTWTERGPKGTRYNRSKSGWLDGRIFEDWFSTIILPYFKKLGDVPKLLIGDNLSSHISESVIDQCRLNNIRFVLLPPNSTHLCQPLDVAFFRPLKGIWRKQLLKWKLSNGGCIPKAQFPALLREALEMLKENQENIIKSGFRASGIFPLDKTQVLKRLPNPNLEVNETALSAALKEKLQEMRYGRQTLAERKKKRVVIDPGKSLSGLGDSSSDTDTQISLHDSSSSIGPVNFSDESMYSEGSLNGEGNIEEQVQSKNSSDENENDLGEIQGDQDMLDEDYSTEQEIDNDIIQKGDFVLVAFPLQGKKNRFKNFLGEILDINNDNTYECKFLRRSGLSKTRFTYPAVDDICDVEKTQIKEVVEVLPSSGSTVVTKQPLDV